MVNNVAYYPEKLAELGWREVPSRARLPGAPEASQTLRFHKGSRELTLAITVLDAEQRVRVYLAEATGQELGLPAPPEGAARPRPAGGSQP